MWLYEKKLQYPAKVGRANLQMAKYLITQYGGPDGELAAALRYLTQRYIMPTPQAKGILTDIGTEILLLERSQPEAAIFERVSDAQIAAELADHAANHPDLLDRHKDLAARPGDGLVATDIGRD